MFLPFLHFARTLDMADNFESIMQSSLEEEGTAIDAASTTELNDEAQEAVVETSIQVQVYKRENTSMTQVCIHTIILNPLKGCKQS